MAAGEEIRDAQSWHPKGVQAWSDRNREVLRQAFTTEQVLLEYDPDADVRKRDDHWVIAVDNRYQVNKRPAFLFPSTPLELGRL